MDISAGNPSGGEQASGESAPRSDAAPRPNGWRVVRRWVAVRLRWLRRRASVGIDSLGRNLDHGDIVNSIREDGLLTGRYVFMVVMSCAIAVLGLLLSSPAVVIGAMLISPLMGPIMLLGFSLCELDYPAMRRALLSLGAGVAGALAISILIVLFSPLREATPEILARTRPNLFDLLVAIFSGLAGGYSVIHRKGATIVGVAIATALMPPLAVVGFGIATGSLGIAGGAFFLFMTNLLAIALSVTALAWLHGFAAFHDRGVMQWQTALVLLVFGGLSLPLGFALRDIAFEARVVNQVRADALAPFNGARAELSSLTVTFPHNRPINVEQTVLTSSIAPGAEAYLEEHYERILGRPVEVDLIEILIDEQQALGLVDIMQLTQSSLAPLQRQIAAIDQREQTASAIRDAAPFRTLAINADAAARRAVIVAAGSETISLAAFREMEAEIATRFPNWTIEIVPPMQELPPVPFETGATALSETGAAVTDTIAWALKRWDVASVEVTGNASVLSGGAASVNSGIALARAQAVSERLEAAGVQAAPASGFGAASQRTLEREFGSSRFQSAIVRPRS
jgi:uncharacterized hydrophobic protein (TIGR00271 family)